MEQPRHINRQESDEQPLEDPPADELQATQDRANELLRDAQSAIDRALSSDSTQYLNVMRQEGGE